MKFILIDDGTLDIVLECLDCHEWIRYDSDDNDLSHDEFVNWCIQMAPDDHKCDD